MTLTQNLSTVNATVYKARSIDYIVIHYFGALGSAEATCAYFKNVKRGASAHYFVDDNGIYQAVADQNASWHCGDSGKGRYKGKCTNANSLGIELRPYKVNAATRHASDTDWYFHAQSIENLLALVKALMAKYGIDPDHVIRHYDVTGKWCPRPWVGDDLNRYYGKTGHQLWAEFKAGLEDDTMDGETIYRKLNAYLGEQPCPDWAKKELQEAVAFGLTDGTRPCELIPRYQAAILAKRAAEKAQQPET